MEIIRDVPGYEKYYSVSFDGKIYSKRKTGRMKDKCQWELKPLDNGHGYLTVMLYDGNSARRHYVHRIVAEAFLSNPLGLTQINHKDENKRNNTATNLEWCSPRYNLLYGGHCARVAGSLATPVAQMTTCSEEILNIYPSAMEAHRQTNVSQGSISKCCKGERKTAGGFKWKYADIQSKEVC